MKKVIVIVLAFLMVLAFVGCSSKLSDEELEQMYEQAKQYESEAKLNESIELFRQLYEYGYTDKDFGHNGLDGAMAIREGRYTRNRIVCTIIADAVRDLSAKLKDPDSLKLYEVHLSVDPNDEQKLVVEFVYGATNSFGGMVKDVYISTHTLSDKQKEDIYESLKKHMDDNGATSENSVRYLVGNYNIVEEEKYDAIVNGTATY